MRLNQRTIARPVGCQGVGLHTGEPVAMRLLPSPPDAGISFVRTDLPYRDAIPARADYVADVALATTLASNGASVGTVEHLLAALAGLGVDNVAVEVRGPEVPIMDGSAAPFAELIRSAGFEDQNRPRRVLKLRRSVTVHEGDRQASLHPAERLELSSTIDFAHPVIAIQRFHLALTDQAFLAEIAASRTFGFMRDVKALKEAGFARGGSLDNAIVLDEEQVINPEGLRFPDEFVRHKILDALGDLALLGMPLLARYESYKTGHRLHHKLLRVLLDDPSAFEVT